VTIIEALRDLYCRLEARKAARKPSSAVPSKPMSFASESMGLAPPPARPPRASRSWLGRHRWRFDRDCHAVRVALRVEVS
jgi:hypothetical protein